MGKKKKAAIQLKPFCYYCDREFDDETILIQHQKAKHFKCLVCFKKLLAVGGLVVHSLQVHKENLQVIPNSIEGRTDPTIEIYGMEGVPEDFLDARAAGEVYDPKKKTRPDASATSGGLLPAPGMGAPTPSMQSYPGPGAMGGYGMPPMMGGPGMMMGGMHGGPMGMGMPPRPPMGMGMGMGYPGMPGMPPPPPGGMMGRPSMPPFPQMPGMGMPQQRPPPPMPMGAPPHAYAPPPHHVLHPPPSMPAPAPLGGPLFPAAAAASAAGSGAPAAGPLGAVAAAGDANQVLVFNGTNDESMEERRAALERYRYDEARIKEQMLRLGDSIQSRLAQFMS